MLNLLNSGKRYCANKELEFIQEEGKARKEKSGLTVALLS